MIIFLSRHLASLILRLASFCSVRVQRTPCLPMTGDDVNVLLIPEEPDHDIQARIAASAGSLWSEQATCQVELFVGEPQWSLRSRDQHGKRKCKGGDEMYIRYEEFYPNNHESVCQAVALIQDHEDGTYSLDFVSAPMYSKIPHLDFTSLMTTKRVLTVYMEYTNGIGRLPAPKKNNWSDGGYTHRCFTVVLSPEQAVRPLIRSFTPPPCTIDLGTFDRILAFGDSTMDQFVRQRPNQKGKYYFQPNLLVGQKIHQGLNSTTLENLLELLEQDFGDILRQYVMEGKSVCIILGSCLWDILDSSDTIQGSEFEDHIQACREYILHVRHRYHVTVAWKSPMAVHIHWVDLNRLIEHDRTTATLFGRDRVRYMSSYRSKYIYQKQRELMEELGVPLLDIYEASYLSADQLYPADGRHYRPDLNRLMLSWFSPNVLRTEKYYQNFYQL